MTWDSRNDLIPDDKASEHHSKVSQLTLFNPKEGTACVDYFHYEHTLHSPQKLPADNGQINNSAKKHNHLFSYFITLLFLSTLCPQVGNSSHLPPTPETPLIRDGSLNQGGYEVK